jgi:hypothetical protein
MCNFPSLESLSVGVVGIATLLYVSTIPKDVRIDLAWSYFDASKYCPCKAVDAQPFEKHLHYHDSNPTAHQQERERERESAIAHSRARVQIFLIRYSDHTTVYTGSTIL